MDNREGQEKSTPPKKIYLQWFGVDKEDLTAEDLQGQPTPGELTWCVDRQFDTDVEYVRSVAGGEPTLEQFVIELAGIYGLGENFLRALPVPTLDMWMMLVREEANRHQGVRETMEKFRKELTTLKFGAGGEPEQWISVETRLPETPQIVLVASDVGRGVAIFDQHWRPADDISYGCFITNIRWWRALPAPSQGKEQK